MIVALIFVAASALALNTLRTPLRAPVRVAARLRRPLLRERLRDPWA